MANPNQFLRTFRAVNESIIGSVYVIKLSIFVCVIAYIRLYEYFIIFVGGCYAACDVCVNTRWTSDGKQS